MLGVFLVEANGKSKSDFMYIKELIKKQYANEIVIRPIYMNGKGNYDKQEKRINEIVNRYIKGHHNREDIFVCICVDIDDVASSGDAFANKNLNEKIQDYCLKHKYNFIWFFKDIESVFLGHKVGRKDKTIESQNFVKKNLIKSVDISKFTYETIDEKKSGTSNLLYTINHLMK